jgi:hypothetical protein
LSIENNWIQHDRHHQCGPEFIKAVFDGTHVFGEVLNDLEKPSGVFLQLKQFQIHGLNLCGVKGSHCCGCYAQWQSDGSKNF